MPPEAALAPTEAPSAAQKPAEPTSTTRPAQRNAKQRKRDFRRDRRRRRRISERLAADPTLTDCTKTVALAALAYSDDSAKPVYPSVGAIAAAASCQRRSARRCLVDLVEAGYIRRIQRPIAARRNATNLYYFCEPLGAPPPHREGQRRRSRTRIGRIPENPSNNDTQDSQNPSSHRRTPESPEPAEQVPNPTPTEPSASAPSASSRKTNAKVSTRPRPPAPRPFQPPESTPETDPTIAQAHLRAARELLRLNANPHHSRTRRLTP
jgi:hypothetical protein